MNYIKIYNQLILLSQSKNRIKLNKHHTNYVYYENHHILPKCLGGSNDKSNLVLLTAKEHYIAHKLLLCIYPGQKMALAFHKMTYSKNGNYIKSAKDYEYCRHFISLYNSGNNHPMSGKTHSEESKNKMRKPHAKLTDETKILFSKLRSGENNPMFGKKQSNETKEKISVSKKGKKIPLEKRINMGKHMKGKHHSDEIKEKIRIGNLGKPSHNKGKKLSEETKKKMSDSTKGENHPFYGKPSPMRGKKMSEESKQKIRESKKGKIPWNKGKKKGVDF